MQLPAQDPLSQTRSIRALTSVSTIGPRLVSAVLFVASSAIMMVAFALTPNTENGVGTHEALGLPPCSLEQLTGIPCATCGMTTSFSMAAHGDLVGAFLNQPAGGLLVVLTMMTVVLSGYALVTGMNLEPIGRIIWHRRVVITGVAVLLLAWAYKIVIHTGMFGVGQ